jgi:hypothetical protein
VAFLENHCVLKCSGYDAASASSEVAKRCYPRLSETTRSSQSLLRYDAGRGGARSDDVSLRSPLVVMVESSQCFDQHLSGCGRRAKEHGFEHQRCRLSTSSPATKERRPGSFRCATRHKPQCGFAFAIGDNLKFEEERWVKLLMVDVPREVWG